MDIILKYFPKLSEKQRGQFAALSDLYNDWNSKINVISRKDIGALYEHHVLHSLAIAKAIRFRPGTKVLDLGTGGGFPGIPLAMAHPEAGFVLCDSIRKKVTVAQSIAREMGLSNVRCVNARAESLDEKFGWVVSRAVTSLENFYPWVRGKFERSILYLKGGDVNAEISALVKKCRVAPGNIRVWSISDWLEDDYFAEKFVIEIGKDYLCPPKSE